MNRKSYIFSVAAVFVTVCVFDFIVHHVLLADLYMATADLWRTPEDMQSFPMIVSQLLFSMIFVFLFSINYQDKGLMEGVRFGLYIGLMIAALDLGSYGYLPIPFALTVSWMAAAILKGFLSGVMVSVVYRAKL